ncbi:MAG: STAS domain-containing protein [bacterium]|jgi:anti-sigma B factor antagonist
MIPVQRDDQDDISIVRIEGELDFENTVWLRGELHELLKQNRVKIILDLSQVELISSYTVGVFVAFARDLRDRGGDLKFSSLRHRLKQTFKATRIDHILDVFDSEEDAKQAFRKSTAAEGA